MQKIKSMRSSTAWCKFFTSNETLNSRFSIARVTVVALVAMAALANPLPSSASPNRDAATSTSTAPTASAALAALKVQSWASHAGYARTAFSDGWGNIGTCDTRNYILQRDMTSVVWRTGANCIVETGTLKDPYTASVIHFVRGVKTSLAVQIDHVVALSNAWMTGAAALTKTARYNLYNDPLNLLAVDGPTNEAKSDSDASAWLPPNAAYRCSYVARQIAVKRKYRLWVTAGEKASMQAVLGTCPGKLLPAG